jgi:exopolysaccharide production protein ExoQ
MHTPPTVALLLTVAFIVFLFRRDIRQSANVTAALWLPLLWILIGCSRSVSQWLGIFGLPVGGASSLEEGSPLDACVYFALIAGGMYVLNKRQVHLAEFVRNNGWLAAFLIYCGVAIVWSDFPFVAFKRWIKILGPPTMALVVLTEPDFEEALIRVMKRCAYVIVPVSILFIKYYPELGRGFDDWTGAPMNTGITTNKNSLGFDCLIVGLFFSWYLLQSLKAEKSKARRNELFLILGFLIMIWWLLLGAHSSTSLVSLLLGMLVIAALGLQSVKRSITLYVVTGLCVTAIAELTFGISDSFIALLHKDPTLTHRTILWSELLNMQTNPIIGVGFESFWLGERRGKLWAAHYWQPNEAHNGYLETYLNLGLIGLFILIGLIIASYRKARLELFRNFQFGRLRLGFLAAVVAYNWTEASFRGPNPLWLVFYIIAIDYPRPQFAPVEDTSQIIAPEDEMELAEGVQSQ